MRSCAFEDFRFKTHDEYVFLSILLSRSISSSSIPLFTTTTGTDARTPSSSAYVLYTSSSLESPFARIGYRLPSWTRWALRTGFCDAQSGVAKNKISLLSLSLSILLSLFLSFFLVLVRPTVLPPFCLLPFVDPSRSLFPPSAFRSEHFAPRGPVQERRTGITWRARHTEPDR